MHSNSTAPEQTASPTESVPAPAGTEPVASGESAGSSGPLAERIQQSAEELAAPAAEACECQDTASLLPLPLPGGLGGLLSDRALKRDVVPVAWSR